MTRFMPIFNKNNLSSLTSLIMLRKTSLTLIFNNKTFKKKLNLLIKEKITN